MNALERFKKKSRKDFIVRCIRTYALNKNQIYYILAYSTVHMSFNNLKE